ncbi:MAG: SRPBCC family protein [Candidatus Kerfeldbacteria bacterium]|nr:SRPBCC family protein [Candidatus Kerfeldbacteria bacterium]
MGTTHGVRHISVYINRPPDDVYDFASNPENLPKWATGLGGSIKNVNGEWIADAPMGKIKIKFAGRNGFGILDHDVILESGERVHNPMRVVPNGTGSEVIFSLFRQLDMADEKFSEDAQWVEKDLKILKSLLE